MTCASPGRWSATDVSLIGDLLRRLNPDPVGREDDSISGEFVSDDPAGSVRVARLLNRAEAEALSAFRDAGLPDVPGVYRRGEGEAAWVPAPEIATPSARFAYVVENAEQGGRHAGLAQIGRLERPDDPIILLASDLLGQVETVRERLAQGGTDADGRHDLEVAFELTMTWMRLCEQVAAQPDRTPKAAAAPKRKTPARPRKALAGGART